jgi:hypothetical protein
VRCWRDAREILRYTGGTTLSHGAHCVRQEPRCAGRRELHCACLEPCCARPECRESMRRAQGGRRQGGGDGQRRWRRTWGVARRWEGNVGRGGWPETDFPWQLTRTGVPTGSYTTTCAKKITLAVDSHRRPNGLLHGDLCKKQVGGCFWLLSSDAQVQPAPRSSRGAQVPRPRRPGPAGARPSRRPAVHPRQHRCRQPVPPGHPRARSRSRCCSGRAHTFVPSFLAMICFAATSARP